MMSRQGSRGENRRRASVAIGGDHIQSSTLRCLMREDTNKPDCSALSLRSLAAEGACDPEAAPGSGKLRGDPRHRPGSLPGHQRKEVTLGPGRMTRAPFSRVWSALCQAGSSGSFGPLLEIRIRGRTASMSCFAA